MTTLNLVTALCPKVVEAKDKMIAEMKARGYTLGMHSGLRLDDEQKKLYALGRTIENPDGKTAERPKGYIVTNADSAFTSCHGYGMAVDMVFKDAKGWTWNGAPKTEKKNGLWTVSWGDGTNKWDQLRQVGKMFGFESGAEWIKASPDFPHFEMRAKLNGSRMNMTQMEAFLKENGIEALWALLV